MIYAKETVACILAEQFGTLCACDVNGNDEWLPYYCRYAEKGCPNPGGEKCWEEFLTFYRKKQKNDKEQINMPDNINHPAHYCKGGIECIDAIRASMSPEAFSGYCKGNIMKYIYRYEEKGGTESLKKAQVYLGWLIETEEKRGSDNATT